MGATYHLVASSEIFLVCWNIMPPEGTNMYSISASYTHKYSYLSYLSLLSIIVSVFDKRFIK